MSVAVYYDLPSFFHQGRAKKKKLDSAPLHPLITTVIESDPELKVYLNTDTKSKQIWSQAIDHQTSKLAIFKNHVLYRILLVHYTRLSFHDATPSPVLYSITFSEAKDARPEIKVYRDIKDRLRILDIAKMELIDSGSPHLSNYRCFAGGALEISLQINVLESQKVFQIQDQSKHELLALTTAEVIDDLIIRLRSFLELVSAPDISATLSDKVYKESQQLMETIYESKNFHTNAVRTLSADPLALRSLLNYRWRLFESEQSKDHSQANLFIEEVLTRGEVTIKESQFVDSSTLFFKLDTGIHLIAYISPKADALQVMKATIKLLPAPSRAKSKSSHHRIEFFLNQSLSHTEMQDLLSHSVSGKKSIPQVAQVTFVLKNQQALDFYSYRQNEEHEFVEDANIRHLYPLIAEFFELHRLENFDITQDELHSEGTSYIYVAKGKGIPDSRLIGFGLVYCSEFHNTSLGCRLQDLNFEEQLEKLITAMRTALDSQPVGNKPVWNRLFFPILPIVNSTESEVRSFIEENFKATEKIRGINLEKILLKIKLLKAENSTDYTTYLIEIKNLIGSHFTLNLKLLKSEKDNQLITPASTSELREEFIRAKGGTWAYHIPDMLHHAAEKFRKEELNITTSVQKDFVELDLDPTSIVMNAKTNMIDYNYGKLIPVTRPAGQNETGVVIGIITDNLHIQTPVKRVLIVGDITQTTRGAISAQECARINAAIRYASEHKLPIDWFSASYGVEIHTERGVESLDASSSTTREIVRRCHHEGLEINLIIDETNIGAQSYWDALATIMHQTLGLLIMTPRGCMALTGPNALVSALFSKAHSLDIPKQAKDLYPKGLLSLSGYQEVHGPNSDAMILANDIEDACAILIRHHYYTYKKSNQKLVSFRQAIGTSAHNDAKESVIREINKFSQSLIPNRQIILEALRDPDSPQPIQLWKDAKGIRWQTNKKGDFPQEPSTIVQEMLVGGIPTMVIFSPIGPLTPADAEIIARAIFKADQRLPVLIIGSLSGFSCDPLSMENRQLMAGASIAKAIVDHCGPLLIVNMGNLVGGTFVVFSKQLNPDLDILALEGSRVQVIGGKAAAKVVFHSKICREADADPQIREIADALKHQKDQTGKHREEPSSEKTQELEESLNKLRRDLIAELENKEGEVFDKIHNVQRALKVGSIDEVVAINNWRQAIVNHLQQQMAAFIKRAG